MINKFDSIIIGFGKGGKTLAMDLANRGEKVALIEKSSQMYGGTCINQACIPTKILENQSSIIRRENLNNLFGDKTRRITDRENVPSALFLDPAFSRVGLNIKKAKAKGHNILVAKMATEAIPRAKQIGKTEGFIKIVIDKYSEKILGATMICEESSEMIHLIQFAIDMGVKYSYLRDRIYAHPTMIESLNDILSPAMIKEV